MLHRSLAVENVEKKIIRTADQHWLEALEYARKQFLLDQVQERLNFFAEIGIGRTIFLYTIQAFAAALELGEQLLQFSYDRSAFTVNLNELLSAICTDFGAALFNNGDRLHGQQLTQKAVQYNPTNQVARNNLNMMSGGYASGGYYNYNYGYEDDNDEDDYDDYDDYDDWDYDDEY